jgi:hypothetical protein
MNFILRPWQLFFLILSGLVNRQQQQIIEFQNAQIRALMDKMRRRRILLVWCILAGPRTLRNPFSGVFPTGRN